MVEVLVDTFWPHPLIRDNPIVEYRAHRRDIVEFPSTFTLMKQEEIIKHIVHFYHREGHTNVRVQKISCLFNASLFPEKIIVFLGAPLRLQPVDELNDQVKIDEVLDKG